MTEVAKRNMIETGALPFIFGILSRQNDYWGAGDLTTQLGVWYNNVANADNMLQLLQEPMRIAQLCRILQTASALFFARHKRNVYP
jgi:hypothetical protein